MAHMYIVRCANGSYYTGSTTDLNTRIAQHNNGLFGAKHTKRYAPVELVFSAEFERVDEAFAFERRVHGWSRKKKEALIEGKFEDLPGLAKKDFGSGPSIHRAAPGTQGPD